MKEQFTKNPWHRVPYGKDSPSVVNAIIEIPTGSKVKYELDKDSGLLKLDRVLFSSVHYPANYGFIPQTYCQDNDPLDILVLCSVRVEPLCLIEAKVIGVMRMIDQGQQDDKIISVAKSDMSVSHYNDLSELPQHLLDQIHRFFEDYKKLQHKEVKVLEFQGRQKAYQIINDSIELYHKTFINESKVLKPNNKDLKDIAASIRKPSQQVCIEKMSTSNGRKVVKLDAEKNTNEQPLQTIEPISETIYVGSSERERYNNIIDVQRAMRRETSASSQPMVHNTIIREFLTVFKVYPCTQYQSHRYETCLYYHNDNDRRRNPYNLNVFRYYPSEMCYCQSEVCEKTHNNFEDYYHPLKYKTVNCRQMNCELSMICCGIHANEYPLLQKSQFFRFDLNTFKSEPCPQNIHGTHQLSSCRFYHGEGDRRRNPNKITYSHVQCPDGTRCTDQNCPKTHNKIEQLYHPSRYKTKYCQNFYKKVCTYHQFCSFAHSDNQILIELLDKMEHNEEFMFYKYKTVWCPNTEGFQERSKKDTLYCISSYTQPESCSEWSKGKIESIEESGCPYRLDCTKSHGWLEKRYHPDLKKWEAGLIQEENDNSDKHDKHDGSNPKEDPKRKKSNKVENLGVGAPFFKDPNPPSHPPQPQDRSKESSCSSDQVTEVAEIVVDPVAPFLISLEQSEVWKIKKTEQPAMKHHHKHHKYSKSKKVKRLYSPSLKQLLLKGGLDEKVKPSLLPQDELILMEDKQVLSLNYLSVPERIKLHDLRLDYLKSHQMHGVKYSKSLVSFFMFKASGAILEKLRKRQVNQNKLEQMSASVIHSLSFLGNDEKESLPELLDGFKEEREFRELNTLIIKQVQPHLQSS